MAKKSNKTAHVLNLISSAKPASEAKEEAKEESKQTAAPIHTESVAQAEPSSIQTSLSQNTKNEELSEKIHDNLLAELENSLSVSQNDTVPTPASETDTKDELSSDTETTENDISEEPVVAEENTTEDIATTDIDSAIEQEDVTEKENDTVQQTTIVNEDADSSTAENVSKAELSDTELSDTELSDTELSDTADVATQQAAAISENTTSDTQENTTEIQDTAIQQEANNENAPSASSDINNMDDVSSNPPHFVFVNICEELVKEKTVEYLERFGVCTCSRCVADAMALALTNIQPKYVVMDPDTAVPFLSYYANKLSVNVMTELTKACLTVLAHPRHDPEEAKLELERKAKKQADSQTE